MQLQTVTILLFAGALQVQAYEVCGRTLPTIYGHCVANGPDDSNCVDAKPSCPPGSSVKIVNYITGACYTDEECWTKVDIHIVAKTSKGTILICLKVQMLPAIE
ncbi:uncharacterized protein RAG0_12781 [Rhynchosporium agropyri]|uniref:Extracellular membrane protein CFEM domain-containing protein n=1 Tax=Rhynchosporium agropyri TaxID=914238 RepID=A0A1E1L9L1_9HELO|nr:uncharacterized protein RAG0_12781 [Rhynchosporium agropyri]